MLPFPECIEAVDAAMRRVSNGTTALPLRTGLPIPGSDGMLGMMPGYLDQPPSFGIKLVSLFPGQRRPGLSSHSGLLLLFEAATGRPVALLNAGEITAIRTAAASAVATRALARADARVLGIVGTGEQAQAHIEALPMVRQFERIVIWGRDNERARAFAESAAAKFNGTVTICATVADLLAEADVVCTVTSSPEPLLEGHSVRAGTHLCVVGSSFPARREVDDDCVARSTFFVDYRPSALAQAGELLHAIQAGRVTESHIRAEIGEVLCGSSPGRRSPSEITLYKSLGVAAQDLAAACAAVAAAQAAGAGVLVDV